MATSTTKIRFWKTFCVFNGALYNTEELKQHFSLTLSSTNEAAVLVEMYELLGEKFTDYLRGMFSIILVNKKDGSFCQFFIFLRLVSMSAVTLASFCWPFVVL